MGTEPVTSGRLPTGEWLYRFAGPAAVVGGLLWSVSPFVASLVESRWINAFYLLPLALLLFGLVRVYRRVDAGPVTQVGYVLTTGGIAVAGVGSVLEAVFRISTLVTWGIGTGTVFFAGFYVLLIGALFLGIGLWGVTNMSRVGPGLLAVALPAALVGFRLFNSGGLQDVNWVPFTVPYGVAWVAIGVDLWRRRESD